MSYNFLICFTVLFSVTSATPKGLKRLFPESKEYIYRLETNISSGTEVPVEASSYWSLEATLHARTYNVSRIRYQLFDIRGIIFDGAREKYCVDFPEAAMSLKQAWDVSVQESGAVAAVYVSENEPFWSSNIKRAIALNLQMIQPENVNSMSYSIQEPCLHGICNAEYSSIDNKSIRKTYDIPTAHPGYGRFFWYSVPTDTCFDKEMKYPFVGSAERIYKLDGDKGLVDLNSRSTLQYYTSSHIFTVNTEFKLKLNGTRDQRTLQDVELHHSYPVYYSHYYKQPYSERVVVEQTELARLTNEYLTKITKGIDDDRVLPNRDLVHNLDVVELQRIMSQLEYDTLMKLYQDLAVGTSYETETSRNIFFEMLPHLKSSASALFVKYLIVEHKQSIEDTTLLSLIRKLPFNVANYSEDLLTKMEVFTILGPDFKKDIRYTCILSYATLAYYTYVNGGCSTDYFGNIVTKYFKMYTEYPGYQDRLIWLQGLSNLQVGSVYNYLSPKILNSSTDLHERFLGLWATTPNVAADPSLSSLLSWPILSNENEPVKLRIAALMQILSTTDQTPGRILDIHTYIMRSNNGQLKKFWHTTAESLKGSEYNCHPSAKYVSRIAKKIFSADPAHWATGNYIYDISDKKNQGSAYLQFISIGEPSIGLPGFAYFCLRTTRDGSVVDDLGVMLITEGVPLHFYMKLSSIASRNGSIEDLVDLLKKLKVETMYPEKVHIDVIVKIQGKTVYAVHLNETALSFWEGNELQRYVQDFVHSGSHINQQMVSFPMQVELDLGTEFGTPVTLQNTMSFLSSLRGGLSASWTDDRFTFETDLTFRYRGTALTSLSTIGPIIFSEHTTRSQQSVVIQLPIKFKLDARPDGKTLKYQLFQPPTGIAVHGRTQIQVRSEAHADDIDTSIHTASDSKQHKNDSKDFANCDDFETINYILNNGNTSIENKIRFLSSFLSSNFIIRHGMILMTMHPDGPCGYYVSFQRSGPLETSLTLREYDAKLESLKLRIEQEIEFQGSSRDPPFQQNIEYSFSSADDNFTRDISFASPTLNYLVCINGSRFTTPNQNTSSSPSRQVRIFFGSYASSCPVNLNTSNALSINYVAEDSGSYSDGGITRYLTLRVAGKLDYYFANYMSESLKLPHPRGEFFNFTVRLKEHNGVVAQSVDGGPEIYFQSDRLGNFVKNLKSTQLLRNTILYRKCTLKGNTVQTFNGTFETSKSNNCEENLVLAECTQRPGFAISRNKNGTYNFYIARDRISISTSIGGVVMVKLNGASVDFEKGYTNSEKTFTISRSIHGVVIKTNESGIRLYYTPEETSILVPNPYISVFCGECMSQYVYNDC